MLEGDAKWGALHGCDAFVLTSHQENFGISVAEALSCSKPVLISEQVNISYEVNEAHAGLVSSDDRKGAVQLLSQWDVLEIKHRDEMSQNANRLFQEQFHLRSAVRRLLNGLLVTAPQTSA
jgi:glycosyltransferase involved in cell wall biosynthesis